MLKTELHEKNSIEPIGSSVKRLDVIPKVTGKAVYSRDMSLSRMLVGRIKRSPYTRAKIMSINVSKAISLAGVKAIITGNDFPKLDSPETPPLAQHEVLYSNQAVVAIAAETSTIAQQAMELVDVEYEPLDATLDPEVTMSGNLPQSQLIIHDGEKTALPNVSRHVKVRKGDFEKSCETADIVIENEYCTAAEAHMQLEPLTFLAQPETDGGVMISGTSSSPHKIQYEVSAYLGIDPCMIRARVPYLGGWFGSKEESHVAAVCAMLAIKSGRAVKLMLSRSETMTATGERHPSKIRIKDAVTSEGRIVGRKLVAIYDGGAYASLANVVMPASALNAVSVYSIDNLEIDSYRVRTNRLSGTPKREPLGSQIVWAIECQMDEIAAKLKLDPIEFRLRNVLRKGEINAVGDLMESIDPDRCLRAASKAIDFGEKRQVAGPWRQGKGVALAARSAVAGRHQAMVRVTASGKVEVWAAVAENGGGSATGIAQIAAAEFGIPLEDVLMKALLYGADSMTMGITMGASGSRQLVNLGKAVQRACRDAKEKIKERASHKLAIPVELLHVRGGKVCVNNPPDDGNSVGIPELFETTQVFFASARYLGDEIGGFVGYGTVGEEPSPMDPETGSGNVGANVSEYYSDSAQAAEVWVNIETGQIKVKKIASAFDAGKALNPQIVRSQIVGAVAMALSGALSEELVFSEGRITNDNLADYKILNAGDAPEIEPIIVEIPFKNGPFGAKQCGEGGGLATAPAVRNAIYDATGAWLYQLPLTPEKILDAIQISARR